jgi:hypothetical protein
MYVCGPLLYICVCFTYTYEDVLFSKLYFDISFLILFIGKRRSDAIRTEAIFFDVDHLEI